MTPPGSPCSIQFGKGTTTAAPGSVQGTFLVSYKDVRQKKSGEPYLSLTLTDRSGDLDAKMWDNAAEALKNVRLYVARERLPKPDADEFYYTDLIGLTAQKQSGETVGTVKAIHNFGAGDLIEIEPQGGGATVMWPFDETTVPLVDVAGGKIVVEPPVDA